MDELVTFNAQFAITEKEWDGEYYHTRTGGESKTVGWSGSLQIAGPSAWLEADPDSPLSPEDDFKLFVENGFNSTETLAVDDFTEPTLFLITQ